MDIQWFPGHMAKAKRLVQENLKLVDAVIELLDARVPLSSRNPMVREILGKKPRLVILNKSDLADSELTRAWVRKMSSAGTPAVAVDSIHGRGINEVPRAIHQILKEKMTALAASGRRPRPPRCMILGIPNVGKSFFINRLVGQRATRTGNKPGVTRGQQWIRVGGGVDLLDTPGILWPKFDDFQVAFKLAVTGAVKEQVFNIEEVAAQLVTFLVANYPGVLAGRYQLEENQSDPIIVLDLIGRKRGLVGSGDVVDTYKSAVLLLKEFREGRLGRFTLDMPE